MAQQFNIGGQPGLAASSWPSAVPCLSRGSFTSVTSRRIARARIPVPPLPGMPRRTRTTYFPGRTPTKSDIRRGTKLLVWGGAILLFGACLSFGPEMVYLTLQRTLHQVITQGKP